VEQQPLKKLLDQVRDALRLKHYSYRTKQSYVDWIKRYVLFHKKRHPKDMGAAEVQVFLTHLAVECKVAASMQNQALSALLFLYREVLSIIGHMTPSVFTSKGAICEMWTDCFLGCSSAIGVPLRNCEKWAVKTAAEHVNRSCCPPNLCGWHGRQLPRPGAIAVACEGDGVRLVSPNLDVQTIRHIESC
jgi:hypothetical protein